MGKTMKRAKLTPWYPPEIKPVRVGPYECRTCAEVGEEDALHIWDGTDWFFTSGGEIVGSVFDWRGLAEKP